MAEATLSSHVDSTRIDRDQLRLIPVPPTTSTFKPVQHYEMVDSLTKVLSLKGINIEREQFAIRHDGSRLFATFDLSIPGVEGTCASLGLRTSNDKSFAVQIIAGMRVFVCDNMAFNGDMIALSRKHTAKLDVDYEMLGAIKRYVQHYDVLSVHVRELQARAINDDQAKAMMWDVVVKHRCIPLSLGMAVAKEYFEPKHPEFEPRTAWSLHNAFTEVIKQVKGREGNSALPLQMDASQDVGKYFGLLGAPRLEAPKAEIVEAEYLDAE
jgi:hypothetical protein